MHLLRKALDYYETLKDKLENSFNNYSDLARAHFRHRYRIDHNLYLNAMDNNKRNINGFLDNQDIAVINRLEGIEL